MFALWVAMRVDYRNLRQPIVIWTAVGAVTLALVAVLFIEEVPLRTTIERADELEGLAAQAPGGAPAQDTVPDSTPTGQAADAPAVTATTGQGQAAVSRSANS